MKFLLIVALAIIFSGKGETLAQPETSETRLGTIVDDQTVRFACSEDDLAERIAECLVKVPDKLLKEASKCAGADNSLKSADEIESAMSSVCKAPSPAKRLAEVVECTKAVIKYKEDIQAEIIFSYANIKKAKMCVENVLTFPLTSNENFEVNE